VRPLLCFREGSLLKTAATDLFLSVITSATEVGNTRPSANSPESVAKIHEVNFYCLTSSVWDDLSLIGDALPSPSYAEQADVMSMRDSYQQPQPNSAQPPAVFEHPCAALKKILSSGSFYYALGPHWDISSRLAERLSRDSGTADIGAFDDRFVWNEYIVRSLLDFRERLDMQEREDLDRCQFIVSASLPTLYLTVFPMIG
jgi:synaptojanin